jgi:hypothetical protein
VDDICLAYDRNRYEVFVDKGMNLLVLNNEENIFASNMVISFLNNMFLGQTYCLPRQQWFRERVSVLLYMYIACLLWNVLCNTLEYRVTYLQNEFVKG